MARLFHKLLGVLAAGFAASLAGCGPGPDDGIPNPALGPPPVIKPERGRGSVPAPPKTAARLPARA